MTSTMSAQEIALSGDRTAPTSKLRLEWVYGYRSANCRNNIHLTENGELVYFSAAIGIVQNIRDRTRFSQRYFLGHDGHIISSCLHPNKLIVATGQMGKTAQICVWNTQEPIKLESLLLGHTDGVGSISFSADGEKLASVGIDSENTIKIWRWRQGKVLASVAGHTERVFDICYYGENVITCGVKHIRFWTLLGNTLQHKDGVFGKSEIQTLLCIGHFLEKDEKPATTNEEDISCFTGALNGNVYIWKKCKIDRLVTNFDDSAIYSIDVTPNGFLTSSKEGFVIFWKKDFSPTSQVVQIPNALNDDRGVSVCSVASRNDYCVVGTRDCEIYGFELNSPDTSMTCLVKGHHDDGLHALACDPCNNLFATGGDDCILKFWNADKMMPIGYYSVPANATSHSVGIRSLSYSHDGKHIAVGFENGSVEIYPSLSDMNQLHRPEPIKTINDRLDSVVSLAYSPQGNYLAVGCIDGNFDIYNVKNNYSHLLFKNSGNELSITNIDWTDDDQYFQFIGEHRYSFTGKMPAMEEVSAEELETIVNWSAVKSFKQKTVRGIWNKFAEKTDIVAIEGNEKNHVIVAGDDSGLVKLFRFPSEKRGAHFKKYPGHASRIGDVRFLHDGTRVISIGVNDRTIIQWMFISEADSFAMGDTLRKRSTILAASAFGGDEAVEEIDDATIEDAHIAHAALQSGAFIESDSEDSDSDLSGADIDSDIEKEKQYSYDRTLYREDYEKLKKSKKITLPPGEKRKEQPDGGLKLEYSFGYRGYDCRDNVFCLKSGEIVYHVAALGIVMNTDKNEQRFYNCHTDDILCLCASPDGNLVATGQIGRNPPVHVWDPVSMETKSILKGQHDRGICAVGFSKDGKLLASVGLDDYRTIVVWNWRRGEKLMSQRGHNDKIFCLRWNPHADDRFVTVGIKHIKFWTLAGGGLTSKQGLFGKTGGKQGKQNQMCVVYGKTADLCITGGGDGSIYIWVQTSLLRKIDDAHNGPVFAITSVQDKGFVSGGKDGKVILWDLDFKKKIKVYEVVNKNVTADSRGQLTEEMTSIRAVTLTRRVVVGTRGGEICEIEKDGRIRVVIQGHAEGEMWGLSCHPMHDEICTVSDDKTVRVWSLKDRRMIRFRRFDKLLRACEYSNDGKLIAVGTKDGQCYILNESNLSTIETIAHRTQEVSDVKFSPDNSLLAVGTHDNFVDIYKVESRKRVGICKANSSYITHVDWDKKGKLLMTNSGDRQQLFYEAPRGTRITSIKTNDIENMQWHTWTGVLGLVCEGIWPPASDITDVNATHLNKYKNILATADDFGLVKLFDFPVKGKHAKFKRYTGHSAHVTRIRWSYDDSYLVSIGGRDVATLIWRHDGYREIELDTISNQRIMSKTTASNFNESVASSTGLKHGRGESDDSDNTDSEEEGYDSDVQHDRDMDYNKRILINPIRAKNEQALTPAASAATTRRKPIRSKVKPSHKKINDEIAVVKVALKTGLGLGLLNNMTSNQARDDVVDQDNKPSGRIVDLQLDHIHGYRGFDCRDNLFYLADNEYIVYPAAGAGIIQHIMTGAQQFYLNHTDDIISMAVHNGEEDGNIVASGQIGENPTIHVWDPKTRKTLSVLSGRHKKGVCSLSFSGKGKLLLSIGVESPYTVAVWRWKEGMNVACTVASENRVFRALFRPNSETQFVSVGVKHLKFWSVAGNTLIAKKAILTNTSDETHSTKMQTMLSITFGLNDRTYTGSMVGVVYVWNSNVLEKTVTAHLGPIFSMFSSQYGVITGAKERRSTGSERPLRALKVWSFDMNNSKAIDLNLPPTDVICVRSVCQNSQGKILVGLKTADIIEIDENSSANRSKSLAYGHGEGELWALSPHPTKPMFATGSFDRNLIIWDTKTKGLVTKRHMSKPIRSLSFHPNGKSIALGFQDGQISLLLFSYEQKKLEDVHKVRERNSDIICIKYSPDGKYVVASSQNCTIDTFETGDKRLKRVSYVNHIEDVVSQIDWSTDSKYIRATTACYTAIVYLIPSMEEVKSHSEMEKITWNTWTSTVGDDIIGIWPKDVKKDHINCAHATSSTIATGDDNGAVNIFQFPCPEPQTEPKSFYGHSANVTNVRFLANERYLISLGGDDCCVFVWKCISSNEQADNE